MTLPYLLKGEYLEGKASRLASVMRDEFSFEG
jgi:hypothetical protein